jgi:hypothetical protein
MIARAVDSKLTAMGKDERVISVAGYVHFDLGDAPPLMRVGHDHAGVDHEGLAAHDAFLHAARHHGLEQLAQEVALAKPVMAVLGKRRMVGNVALEAQSAEPATCAQNKESAIGAPIKRGFERNRRTAVIGDRGTQSPTLRSAAAMLHPIQPALPRSASCLVT